MKKIIVQLTVICLFLAGTQLFAGPDIIPAQDFTKLIKNDKSVVIIDANKADEYQKMHVINSINVPHQDLYVESGIEGMLKSPAELATYFGNKGVSNNSKIIIYDDGSNKYSTRVYWVLKYLGAEDVTVLHKDMDDWRKARVPITGRPTRVKAATFTPSPNTNIIADMNHVKEHVNSGDAVIIDARTADEYKGVSETPESKGHIAKSINIDYKEFLKDNGAFKSAEELKSLAAKYNLSADKEIILYCITSVRAAVGYFALTEILEYPDVKVYDGAYNEWVSNPSNPVAK